MATLSDASTMTWLRASAMAVLFTSSLLPSALADEPAPDARPLSSAQVALFETPHLHNVVQPETLDYGFTQDSAAGFTDKVAVHIRHVNEDGSKDVSFDYLTGEHQVRVPELDHFQGNPLLMLALERDVADMKTAVGLSASFFRNKIREAFVTDATVSDVTFTLDGAPVPAREITIHPFAEEDRLGHIKSLQAKSYSFVLADAVPGTLAEIRIVTPADAAMAAPAFSQRIVFTGVEP